MHFDLTKYGFAIAGSFARLWTVFTDSRPALTSHNYACVNLKYV